MEECVAAWHKRINSNLANFEREYINVKMSDSENKCELTRLIIKKTMEDSLRVVLPDLENLDIEIKFVEDQNNSANRTITIAPNMSIPKEHVRKSAQAISNSPATNQQAKPTKRKRSIDFDDAVPVDKHRTDSGIQSDLERHQCEFCHISYANKRHLKDHQTCKHYEMFPFHCSVCKQGFYNKSGLQEHDSYKCKKRVTSCPYCKYVPSIIGNLKRHINKMHPNI